MSLPIINLHAKSEKFSPFPLTKAVFNSSALILPERSLSTIPKRRCVSGDTPGMAVGGGA